MAKIYTKNALTPRSVKPKKEVISFLLNYSKALTIVKLEGVSFEFIAN